MALSPGPSPRPHGLTLDSHLAFKREIIVFLAHKCDLIMDDSSLSLRCYECPMHLNGVLTLTPAALGDPIPATAPQQVTLHMENPHRCHSTMAVLGAQGHTQKGG